MRATLLLPLLLGLAAPAEEALREGSRRFHAGEIEEAFAAYEAGYDRTADPLLAYNLGVAAHHLERLPEALLWYRRAEAAPGAPGKDFWLRENLALVRGQLHDAGVRGETDSGWGWGFWMDHRHRLVGIGALLAWGALPAVLLPRSARARRAALAAVVIAAGLPFAAGLLLGRFGPRAAVLLRDCAGRDSRYPAGSEIRVFPLAGPDAGPGWRIPGTDLVCPDRAVGLVEP